MLFGVAETLMFGFCGRSFVLGGRCLFSDAAVADDQGRYHCKRGMCFCFEFIILTVVIMEIITIVMMELLVT